MSDRNLIARRTKVYGCENGFCIDKNVIIEDSFIYDFDEHGPDPHTDGVQVSHLSTNVSRVVPAGTSGSSETTSAPGSRPKSARSAPGSTEDETQVTGNVFHESGKRVPP